MCISNLQAKEQRFDCCSSQITVRQHTGPLNQVIYCNVEIYKVNSKIYLIFCLMFFNAQQSYFFMSVNIVDFTKIAIFKVSPVTATLRFPNGRH